MSRVTVLPVLVVTVAYGLSGPSWVFAAVLMVLALVATVLRQRLRLHRARALVRLCVDICACVHACMRVCLRACTRYSEPYPEVRVRLAS